MTRKTDSSFLLYRLFLSIPILVSFTFLCNAQTRIGVGTTEPDSSSILHLQSDSLGLHIPTMTTLQIDSILNPATGLQVYNSDKSCIYTFDGIRWNADCGRGLIKPNLLPPIEGKWNLIQLGPHLIERIDAVTFSLGGDVYVGTGNRVENYYADFYKFDPTSESWTLTSSLPGNMNGRSGAVAFTIGNTAYVGTGKNLSNNIFDDFFKYDLSSNTWSQISSHPSLARKDGVGFNLGDFAYVGLGQLSDYLNDMHRYDPSSDTWIEVADFPGAPRSNAVSFTLDGNAYVGLGENGNTYFNDFYKYSPDTDSWSALNNFPDQRSECSIFKFLGQIICGRGEGPNNDRYRDFYKYDLQNDAWIIMKAQANKAVKGAVAFSVNGKGYVIGGNEDPINFIQKFERYTLNDYLISINGSNNINYNLGDFDYDTTNEFIENITLEANVLTIREGDQNSIAVLPTYTFNEVDSEVGSNYIDQIPRWDGNSLTSSVLTDDNSNIGIGIVGSSDKLHILSPTEIVMKSEADYNGYAGIYFKNGQADYSIQTHRNASNDYRIENNLTTSYTEFNINDEGIISLGMVSSPTVVDQTKLFVNGNIHSNSFRDRQSNGEYFLNLSISNAMKAKGKITVQQIVDFNNPSYHIDPADHLQDNSSIYVLGDVIMGTSTNGSEINLFHNDIGIRIISLSNANNLDKGWQMKTLYNVTELSLINNLNTVGYFSIPGGLYSSLSDSTSKSNIKDVGNLYDAVLKLEPSEYSFINDKESKNKIGFIAQEVQSVFPELVNTPTGIDEKECSFTLDYNSFGILAIKVIQERSKLIKKMKQENIEIKMLIMENENRLAQLESLLND